MGCPTLNGWYPAGMAELNGIYFGRASYSWLRNGRQAYVRANGLFGGFPPYIESVLTWPKLNNDLNLNGQISKTFRLALSFGCRFVAIRWFLRLKRGQWSRRIVVENAVKESIS